MGTIYFNKNCQARDNISEEKVKLQTMREKRTKLTISVSITVPETILWTFSIGGRTIPRLDDKILCTIFNI